MSARKRGLGKGLDLLLSTSNNARQRQVEEDTKADSNQQTVDQNRGDLRKLPIEWLRPGKYQPRKDMSAEALEELAHSIEAQGVIQPIVVRELGENQFEIIAGERRWRASQQIHLHEVPCLIKNVSDENAVAIALIENIQREDLNAMEEAVALDRLMTEFELTHQQVAEAVGKSRTTVTNLLRLNSLDEDVKILLEHGDIEMGHARALLALSGETQAETARNVAAKGLTVRDTEKLVKTVLNPKAPKPEAKVDPDINRLEQRISERLGAGVKIQQNKKGQGKLVIDYANLDELDAILALFIDSDETL
ncbi:MULTISPECIES: ParB/RepB/Spo0J family partition protein [unclassified Agarivorans]|uniref:ParB/RepB/Spo0J family partition protein n=1 Tax=unclassified Agarivorans TaxID=2636026 RepID=UPI0010F85614|nr:MULTISPECIES: ParB/RepB/Spo0J family partition protein [unclassified Agarivorans]MDO6685830.1 ParB/RepB/Spo0J family partition protein [Agarivorans sp. 3_MG-2023]MDO6716055.1 ParB/RepB/Spo0J family partition protein [Agarivorans sp. 2_MG-2023]MDO6764220.1 ParB/RepB/Spo0J family partition protein [Agarivorans sp. 1_MG-2023]